MRPTTLWEQVADWFGYLPVRLAFRIIWLAARLGGRTARAVELHAWDTGLGVPCPPGRDPNAMFEPRYTASEWQAAQEQSA